MTSRVSLYIPCYNAGRFLDWTLRAVERQTLAPSEVIVVDDGSTDGIEGIARSHSAVYVRHSTNRGLAAARNTGVKISSHNLVASIDADCYPAPTWLESLAHWADQGVAGVGGRLLDPNTRTCPDRWRAAHMRQEWGEKRLVNPPFLFGSNTLFRKDVLQVVGGYDNSLRTNYEDVDVSMKIRSRALELVYEPRAVAYHQRTDSIRTVAETYWRWENPSPYVKYPGGNGLFGGIWWDTHKAVELAWSDFLQKRPWGALVVAFWTVWVRMSVSGCRQTATRGEGPG
jgi:hypothetical protein